VAWVQTLKRREKIAKVQLKQPNVEDGMSVEPAPAAKPPRKFLPWAAAAIGLLLLVAFGWTQLWRFAAGESEKTIEAWIAREKSFGRIWSCPERKIEGFPFAIEIACAKPRFDGVIFGRHFAGGLNGLRATAVLTHPSAVTAQIASPFAVLSDDRKIDLELAWNSLDVVLDGLPQNIWRVTITGEKLVLRGNWESIGAINGTADHLSADAAEHPEQSDRAYDFKVAVSDATLPDIDRFLGATLPAEIGAQGTLTEAAFDPSLTVAENIDHWRAAGGRLDLVDASLAHGETTFKAHGALSLDDSHRVEGKLDTESRGFEPLLLRLGVNPMLVSAGALLSNLIAGALPSRAETPPETLIVTIGFDSGRVSIGPARTSIRVPPLY